MLEFHTPVLYDVKLIMEIRVKKSASSEENN